VQSIGFERRADSELNELAGSPPATFEMGLV
jgi:hypothetical protein